MHTPAIPKKLSVLMPVYNEGRTLRTIIERVLNCPLQPGVSIELICVDDGSKDSSRQILAEYAASDPRITYIPHEKNGGKGAAIRTAITKMTGDIAIIQDADLEYDPVDFPALLQPILDGRADAVFGSRFASRGQRRVMLYWHGIANRMLTEATNILNNINLTDMETGYKAIRTDILKLLPLKAHRFGIEPELSTRLAQWGARIYEVPISYHGRTYAEGKNIHWTDGIAALWHLFKFRFVDTKFTTHEGFYILQSVRRARGFNKWMLDTFRKYVGKRVFEAGCGIGNFTEQLLRSERLIAADFDPLYVEMIHRRFGHLANFSMQPVDLTKREDFDALRNEKLDTAICLNVVEHIEDDRSAINNLFHALEPGGHAIVLVPAHPWLYTGCDKALGHFRRYTEIELREKMTAAGFEVVEMRQFNRFGVLGWWLNGKLGRKDLSPGQMRLFELLLPLAKLHDATGIGPGLSLIAVGRKPRAHSGVNSTGSAASGGASVG